MHFFELGLKKPFWRKKEPFFSALPAIFPYCLMYSSTKKQQLSCQTWKSEQRCADTLFRELPAPGVAERVRQILQAWQ